MNSKHLLLIMIIGFSIIAMGCTGNNNSSEGMNLESNTDRTINIDKLEIYHFHGNQQCYSCVTLGQYAEETVNTYFQEELNKGIIVFNHINGQLPQNKELILKYGAAGSSLWLGVYNEENFTAEQNINVWYKLNNKADFMNYFSNIIEQKLAGN